MMYLLVEGKTASSLLPRSHPIGLLLSSAGLPASAAVHSVPEKPQAAIPHKFTPQHEPVLATCRLAMLVCIAEGPWSGGSLTPCDTQPSALLQAKQPLTSCAPHLLNRSNSNAQPEATPAEQ